MKKIVLASVVTLGLSLSAVANVTSSSASTVNSSSAVNVNSEVKENSNSSLTINDLKSCTSCHGNYFEKIALGKSKIVNNMTEEEITNSLKGYKDGTYGGPLKGVMVRPLVKFSNDDMSEIAKLIKGLTEDSSSAN